MIASNDSIAQGREKRAERASGEARKRFGTNIDGSNHSSLKLDRECAAIIHRAYAVGMAWPSPRPQVGWKRAERRKKREERKWPQARFTAFLKGPVTTSKKF